MDEAREVEARGSAREQDKVGSRLQRIPTASLVQAAAILTLLALALMVWSVLDPTPMPVMVAMSVGQVLGSLALLLYVVAVIVYQLRLAQRKEPPKTD